MAEKRCYNLNEAMHYFGIDRNAFKTCIEPELEGKGVHVGTCLVYEAGDLDKAWDAFKKKAKASAATAVPSSQSSSDAVPKKTKARAKEAMPSANLGSDAWNAAVTKVLNKPRKK
jgi:hypothetical protein